MSHCLLLGSTPMSLESTISSNKLFFHYFKKKKKIPSSLFGSERPNYLSLSLSREVLPNHSRLLRFHQLLHNYFSQQLGRTLEHLSSYCLQQLFSSPPSLFTVSYLRNSSQSDLQDPQGRGHIFPTVTSPISATQCSYIRGYIQKCSAQFPI